MSFYPVSSVAASSSVQLPGPQDGSTSMVAVPVSALAWPVGQDCGGDGRSGLVVGGGAPIRSGELVAWCKVVAVTPAVVRRDGRVQAAGRPCEHARLGGLEAELDARCGPGVIDRIAAGVKVTGKVKAKALREMSIAFTIRAVLLLTLMPDADAHQVLSVLLGDLLAVPWQRPHTVPSGTVLSTWRAAVGPAPLQQLQHLLLQAVVAEHAGGGEPGDDDVPVGGGLRLGSIDGTVTAMPDTRANRARFGTAGRDGDGFPQIRHLHASDAPTRATLAAVTGPAGGDKAEAEQALLDRMLTECSWVFTKQRLFVIDRNFPGVPRIARLIDKTHVLIRVKSDIRLDRIGAFLPDGSYLAWLSGGGTTLIVRVVEYHVSLDGQTTPELFCLITDLLDHNTHPAGLLAAAYKWRWDGSETALREAKSTLHGAGPGTGAMLRSHAPDLIDQEHAAWIVATELVHATVRSAAATAGRFSKGPRAGQAVAPRHLSFTTARRTLTATVAAGTATASLPAPQRANAHQATLQTIAAARVTTDRHRHRPHKIKSRQAFGHAPRDITTRTSPAVVTVCGTTPPAAA